jgi:hypothetical protein
MQRLELSRVHVCQRCGRGRAELTGPAGTTLSVRLDQAGAQELSAGRNAASEVRWLSQMVLANLAASGAEAKEVVFDLDGPRLRALLSFLRSGEPDVVAASPQEGLVLAVRGDLPLYASDEAMADGAAREGASGARTVH